MSKIWDLVIVGAGPAALTAALYAAREKLEVIVYEKQAFGGKVATISHVENFPGVGVHTTGMKLAEDLKVQAEHFGAAMEYGEVENITVQKDGTKELTIDGEPVLARAVLIATGCENRRLGVPGEASKGVHYCATCDGSLFADKNVIVVGGGNSAVQETFYLDKIVKHITIISATKLTASVVLKHKLKELIDEGKVNVRENETISEILSENGRVVGAKLPNGEEIKADGVFVFIGLAPDAKFLTKTKVELDEFGFIKTNADMVTDEPGIFAAGDVRSGSVKQMVTAAGEGATAAMAIGRYLA